MATKNIFKTKFINNEVFKAKVEALDNAEISYRKLTMSEADMFTDKMIKDFGEDGTPVINRESMNEIKYEKIALCLIEPKMSIEDLKDLPADAINVITEIGFLIDGISPKSDEDSEGN